MKTLAPLIPILMVVFIGCSSTYNVSRIDLDEEVDLTGSWNEQDARIVSEEMIQDITRSGWIQNYLRNPDNARPILIVGNIRNETMEHIDTEIIVRSLERQLINSGDVGFVASRDTREWLRDERLDQQAYSSPETAARLANETGADYMLFGNINAEYDETERGDQSSVFYNVNLELINLESNEIVWIGEKQIRKLISRSRVRM